MPPPPMSLLEDRHCRCPLQGDTPPGRCRPPRRWEEAHLQAQGWGPEGEVLAQRYQTEYRSPSVDATIAKVVAMERARLEQAVASLLCRMC